MQARTTLRKFGLFLVLFVGCFHSAAHAGPVIGTFDGTRSTTANLAKGFFAFQARASLASQFPGYSFATDLILSDSFLSGVDVLMITSVSSGSTPIASLSVSEQNAMMSFILRGGTALLLTEGAGTLLPAAQSIVAPFGMSVTSREFSAGALATPTDLTHPIISGPFGNTTSIQVAGYTTFDNLGPYAHTVATLTTTGMPVVAVIEEHALGPHSGRVVLISNTDVFKDQIPGQSAGSFVDNKTFFSNTMQFLVPEPDGAVLGVIAAAAAAAILVFRRRAKA